MKRVLLTLAAVAVAASPILAAAEPEHKEGPRPEAAHRPEAARESHAEGVRRDEQIRADHARGLRHDEGREADHARELRHDEGLQADHARGLRRDEALRADHAAGLRHDEALRADRAGAYRRGVEVGEHRQYFDRGNPGWWRGRPEFAGYGGPRPGYWFVPGLGYRGVPAAYWGYHWGVGLVVPGLFFGNPIYYVNNPWFYGVEPAPYRYHWMYLGPNLALVNPYGRIVRIVPNVF